MIFRELNILFEFRLSLNNFFNFATQFTSKNLGVKMVLGNKFVLSLSLLLFSGALVSQNQTSLVLKSILENNKTLKAAGHWVASQKLEAKTGIYLANPSVTYDYLWGNQNTLPIQSEVNAIQEFDFPGVYKKKAQHANLQATQAEIDGKILRQSVLLEAQSTCIELVYLNKQKTLLQNQLNFTTKLLEMQQARLQKGESNILEVNILNLNLVTLKSDFRKNETNRNNLLKKLAELNGGASIEFTDTSYFLDKPVPEFETIKDKAVSVDPSLASLSQKIELSKSQIAVTKALSYPKFELGYRGTYMAGDNYNGIHTGISIPLWENKNAVKTAKAQSLYWQSELESEQVKQMGELRRLYDECQSLKISLDDYQSNVPMQQSVTLLNKALQAGEISAPEYFAEMCVWSQSHQALLQLEYEYYQKIAELMKFEL